MEWSRFIKLDFLRRKSIPDRTNLLVGNLDINNSTYPQLSLLAAYFNAHNPSNKRLFYVFDDILVEIAARPINTDWRVDPLLIKCLIGSLRSCGIIEKYDWTRCRKLCAYVVVY